MSSNQNKSTARKQFWHFLMSKKAQLPAMRITEQPLLLTKSKIKRTGDKFPWYFCYKRAVKTRTRCRPRRRI